MRVNPDDLRNQAIYHAAHPDVPMLTYPSVFNAIADELVALRALAEELARTDDFDLTGSSTHDEEHWDHWCIFCREPLFYVDEAGTRTGDYPPGYPKIIHDANCLLERFRVAWVALGDEA